MSVFVLGIEPESFGKSLRSGRGLLGSWCTFASFASTEVMAGLGFDFLVMDLQHCELKPAEFPALLGAFREPGPRPVVRAPRNEYHVINWLFDQGVAAVIVPMVNSPEEARRAVEAAKFPPLGKRSFGPYRAAAYGTQVEEYVARADELATLIVQVEDEKAAREIDLILAVPGIDAVFVGPNDLAFSMLRPGESLAAGGVAEPGRSWTTFARTPAVIDLCHQMLAKARAAGIPFGMTAGSIEEARGWLARGASFATFGNDFQFLQAGAKALCGFPA